MKKSLFLLSLIIFSVTMSAKVYVCTAPAAINIRTQPSTQGSVVGALQPNQTVDVVVIKGDWAMINYNGATAYVAAKFLTEQQSLPTSRQVVSASVNTKVDKQETQEKQEKQPVVVSQEGRLNVNSNPSEAQLYVDSQHIGLTPYEMRLDCKNSHTIRLEKEGYSPFQQTILLDAGQVRNINASLELVPVEVPITFSINVPAHIKVDGQDCGETDSLTHILLEGQHKYIIEKEGYFPQTSVFNVKRDKRTKIIVQLIRDSRDSLKEVRALKIQKIKNQIAELPWTNTIMLNYLYDGGHSLGLTYARCKLAGFYVNTMIGLDWQKSAGKAECYSDYDGDCLLTNQRKDQRLFSITAGGVLRMGCPLYLYTGLGYGYNKVLNKSMDGRWIEVYGSSCYRLSTYSAFNYQCGLMGNIKGFTISAGYSLLYSRSSCIHHEIQVGIGYTF